MNLPNFFIIGAPKAGTTALYDALTQHPEIYMSPVKEPFFFAFKGEPPIFPAPIGDHIRRVTVWKPAAYALLFAGVTNQRAIGEASTNYLRSPLAAQRIKQSLPQSRIIAILRQPVERAYSHYTFHLERGFDYRGKTFEEALAREDACVKEGWYSGFHKTNGYYHAQLSDWYARFPHEQIKVYLYEDWKNTPQVMLRDLFRFLEVDEDFAPEIRRSNVTLLPKSRRLHNMASNSTWIEQFMPFLPTIVRRAVDSALCSILAKFNLAPPPPLDPEIRARLTEDYREDILKLQDLIGRDLSHWLKAPTRGDRL